MAKRIICFFFDELRTDALECYGNPVGKMLTPNIDSIAERGTLYKNCFCNSPVCVPSRASILTGLYPEDMGVYGNEASLPPFNYENYFKTFPDILEQNRFRTASFGKTHLPRGMRVFQKNDQAGSEMDCGLGEKFFSIPKISASGEIQQNLGSAFPKDQYYRPNLVAQNSIEWIKRHYNEDFFLRVSFLQPHTPVLVPEEFVDLYSDYPFSGECKPTKNASFYEQRFVSCLAMDTISPDNIKRMKQLYYALVSWVDSQVGMVLHALEDLDILKDTILIINSDHGCNLGECGAYAKFLFSPHSQRVPLIISVPGMTKKTDENLCSNIDVSATILSILGIEKPDQFKGSNLLDPLIHRNPYVYGTIGYGAESSYPLQYDAVGSYSEGKGWPRRACIRTSQYRLDMNIRINSNPVSESEEDIFFTDYLKYPEEDVNLAITSENSQYLSIIKELREKLLSHCANSAEVDKASLHAVQQLLISKEFFKYLDEDRDKKY